MRDGPHACIVVSDISPKGGSTELQETITLQREIKAHLLAIKAAQSPTAAF